MFKPPMTTPAERARFSPAVFHGPPAPPGVVWHYTTSPKAKAIVASGVLRPFPQYEGTKPILWCSLNHVWEPCAVRRCPLLTTQWNGITVPKTLTFEGLQAFGTRLVRFAVPLTLVPYSHHAAFRLAGVKLRISRMLVTAGVALGGRLDDWRATLEPVPQQDWLSIDVWNRSTCRWDTAWSPEP